jgi:hypothetical protein
LFAACTLLALLAALATALTAAPRALADDDAAPPPSEIASPQAGEEGAPPPALAPAANQQQLIAQVVQELNAAAIAHPPADVGEDGEGGEPPALAAVTYFGAEGGPCSVSVGLVAAQSAAGITDVTNELLADPRIASVTAIDAIVVTPTVAQLSAFDCVLVWTNSTPLDNIALGNNLADYVDAGGGVVLGMFAMQASLATRIIGGRFLTDNYYCIQSTVAGSVTGAATLGTVDVFASPLMAGVGAFNGGTSSFRPSGALHPLAMRIAAWSTGENLVAQRNDLSGRRVDLGFLPVSSAASAGSWTLNGDLLMANALAYVGGCPNVGFADCAPTRFAQNPPVPSQEARNSNTPINLGSTQQIADDFNLSAGGNIQQVTLFGIYLGNGDVPLAQRFVINIHANTAGNPGAIINTTTAVVTPEYTGAIATGLSEARLYRFTIQLTSPFNAAPGVTYWLSPLGDNASNTWSWQFVNSAIGTRRSRPDGASPWTAFGGNMAFTLCGRCDCNCSGDTNGNGVVDVDDLIAVILGWGVCP